ncbi:MAG: LysE family transporter, partial [Pseudomonadota bacterium]
GAAYLLWLGLSLWRASLAPRAAADPAEPMADVALAPRAVAGHAFSVTALNPKSIAFFVAFVPQFIDDGAPYPPQAAVLIALFVALATLNAIAYALLADAAGRRLRRPSVRRWVERAGGTALIAMAGATATVSRS